MIGPQLASRARGLSSRLLSVATLEAVRAAADERALASALATGGYPLPVAATGDEIDRAIWSQETRDLAVLSRWQPDAGVLAVLRDDIDRRGLRAVCRALAGRGSAAPALAYTAPTLSLPARAVAQLAAATTTGEVGAILRRVDHPFADLVPVDLPLDPLAFEHALARRLVDRARRHVGRSRALARFVAQTIDGDNAAAALLLAQRGGQLAPAEFFAPGGDRLDQGSFIAAASADLDRARSLLAQRFARTPLADALAGGAPAHALESALLDWQLATQTALRRQRPLGAATVLWLALRRRLECRQVRRARWRLALGGRQ